MKKTVNTSHVRSINQRAVLDAIYRMETTSRAELARILNMSKPSMADNVADLLDIGIIQELGEGACAKGGGRKPVLLSFCDNFKYIIAMDFHYHNSLFALSNLKGQILNEFTIHQTPMSDFQSWAQMCINAVAMLMSAQNITGSDLAAIAVSAPGILDLKENQYIVSSRFGDFNVAYLEQQLKHSFGVPVLIKNSTNAAALGEFYYGSGMDCDNMLYVSCGQGVGAGLILGGRLYEGSHLASGEIGYFVFPDTACPQADSPSPAAPRQLRLEDRICIDSILRSLNASLPPDLAARLSPGEDKVTFSRMITLWEDEDPHVLSSVNKICYELGCAVCCLQSVFDCQKIILGGEYLAFARQLIPAVQKLVDAHCPIPVSVVASQMSDKATVLGLITTCREFYFSQICSR